MKKTIRKHLKVYPLQDEQHSLPHKLKKCLENLILGSQDYNIFDFNCALALVGKTLEKPNPDSTEHLKLELMQIALKDCKKRWVVIHMQKTIEEHLKEYTLEDKEHPIRPKLKEYLENLILRSQGYGFFDLKNELEFVEETLQESNPRTEESLKLKLIQEALKNCKKRWGVIHMQKIIEDNSSQDDHTIFLKLKEYLENLILDSQGYGLFDFKNELEFVEETLKESNPRTQEYSKLKLIQEALKNCKGYCIALDMQKIIDAPLKEYNLKDEQHSIQPKLKEYLESLILGPQGYTVFDALDYVEESLKNPCSDDEQKKLKLISSLLQKYRMLFDMKTK